MKLLMVILFAVASAWSMVCADEVASKPTVVWIEAEDAVEQNFNPGLMVMADAEGKGASDGKFLKLHNYIAKGEKIHYHAVYEFSVPVEGEYRLWMSSTPQHGGWASPFSYKLDDRPIVNLAGRPWVSEPYGVKPEEYFGWFTAGDLKLKAGKHRIRIDVRKTRDMDTLCLVFFDAMFLTTDKSFVPVGNHPGCSPKPELSQVLKTTSYADYMDQAYHWIYRKKMTATREMLGPASEAEVIRKIMARPLPKVQERSRPSRFGMHGMASRFIVAGENKEKTAMAYELLARAGVESFRTWDSMWFQLGDEVTQFTELDFQFAQAQKYGQTFMLMVGYPPRKYALVPKQFTAVKAIHEDKYRVYLRTLFNRYKDKGMIEYAELGNEVDAPDVWWQDATPEMYVREAQILRQELIKIDPKIRILAFGATYSRDEQTGGPKGGRAFVRKCFELGIDKYVDAYSMHYTWPAEQRDFPAFFRREMAKRGSSKPLVNSEEASSSQPYDVLKLLGRDFYLYGFERVDYYQARDWFEVGNLIYSGMFDYDWNPKLRLLPYALSVDAMKNRKLVGMAEPVKGVEAYVLEYEKEFENGQGPAYSIVMWNNGGDEKINPLTAGGAVVRSGTKSVNGLSGIQSVWNWRLDRIEIDSKNPMITLVEDQPVVVFASTLPAWKLMTPEEWIKKLAEVEKQEQPLLPTR